jgi:hypothetical protein
MVLQDDARHGVGWVATESSALIRARVCVVSTAEIRSPASISGSIAVVRRGRRGESPRRDTVPGGFFWTLPFERHGRPHLSAPCLFHFTVRFIDGPEPTEAGL